MLRARALSDECFETREDAAERPAPESLERSERADDVERTDRADDADERPETDGVCGCRCSAAWSGVSGSRNMCWSWWWRW
jgi:hypothetical protein